MKLLFKQRLFSWFDSYDIYDEMGNTVYVVKGQLDWGHRLVIYDAQGREIGIVREKVLVFLPKFELIEGGRCVGILQRELSFFHPRYHIGEFGWHAEGSILEWDYSIVERGGKVVAHINKEIFHLTDTYVINVADPRDALHALMFVLGIDAEKCSNR